MKIKIKSLRSEAVDPKAVSGFYGPRLADAAKKVAAKYPELDPGDSPDELGLSGKLSDAEKKLDPKPAPGMADIPAGGAEAAPVARPAIPTDGRPERIAGPAAQRAAAQDSQNVRKGKEANTYQQDWKKVQPLIQKAIDTGRYNDKGTPEEVMKKFEQAFSNIYAYDFRDIDPATINTIFRNLPLEARAIAYDLVIRKPVSSGGDPKKSGLIGTAAKELGANVKAAVGFTRPERDFSAGSAISRTRGETEARLESDILQPIENKFAEAFKAAGVEPLLDLKNRIEASTKVGGGAKGTASSPEFDKAIKNFLIRYNNINEKHKDGKIKTDAANSYIEGMKNILMYYKEGKLTKFSESKKYNKQQLNELFGLRNKAIDNLLSRLVPLDPDDYNFLNGGPPAEAPAEEPKATEEPKAAEPSKEKLKVSDEDLLKIALDNKANAQKRFDVFKQNMDSIIGNLDEIIDSMFQKVSPRKKYDYYSSSDVSKPVDNKDSEGNYNNFESPMFERRLKLVVREGKIQVNEIKAIDPLSALKVFKFKLREKLKKVVSTIKLEDFIKAYIKVAKTQFNLTLGDEKNTSKLKKALTSFRLLEADEREDAKPLQAGARLKGITALKDTEYKLLDLVLRVQNPKKGLVDYVIETFSEPTVNLSKVYSPEQLKQIETYIKSAFKVVSAGDTFSSSTTSAGGKNIKGTAKISPADQKSLASKLVGGENDELKGKGKGKLKGTKVSAGAIGASPFGISRTSPAVSTSPAVPTSPAVSTSPAVAPQSPETGGEEDTEQQNPEIKKILSLFGAKGVPVRDLNVELAQKLAYAFIKFLEDKKSGALNEAMRMRFMQLAGMMDEAKFAPSPYSLEIEKFLKEFQTSSGASFSDSVFKKIKGALSEYVKDSQYASLFNASTDTSTNKKDDKEDDNKVTEPEVSEPETAEPETTKPETTKPEVSEPEVSEPEAEPEVDENTLVGKLVKKARSAGISQQAMSDQLLIFIFKEFISFFDKKKQNNLKEDVLFEGLKLRFMQLAGVITENLEEAKQSEENKLIKEFFDSITGKLSKQTDENSKKMLQKIKDAIGSSRLLNSLRQVMTEHMKSDAAWKSKTDALNQDTSKDEIKQDTAVSTPEPEASKGGQAQKDTSASSAAEKEARRKEFLDMLKGML